MSTECISWALKFAHCSASEKSVLFVLANNSNQDGIAWPGQQSIAHQTCLSASTVMRALASLDNPERPGGRVICRERRSRRNGSRTSDMVHLVKYQEDNDLTVTMTGRDLEPNRHHDGAQPVTMTGPEPLVLEPSVLKDGANGTQRAIEGLSSNGKLKGAEVDEFAHRLFKQWPKIGRRRSSIRLTTAAVRMVLKEIGHMDLLNAVAAYLRTDEARKDDCQYVKGLHCWLKEGRYDAFLDEDTTPGEGVGPSEWAAAYEDFETRGAWDRSRLGPPPSEPGHLGPTLMAVN